MAENDEGWGREQETVRIGSAGDIYVYKVQEHELGILKSGYSGSVDLNIALALIPAAVALGGSLFLCPSDTDLVRSIFLMLAAAFFAVGVYALIRWYPTRRRLGRVVREIRERAEDDAA